MGASEKRNGAAGDCRIMPSAFCLGRRAKRLPLRSGRIGTAAFEAMMEARNRGSGLAKDILIHEPKIGISHGGLK